jgi:hypothetical protein
LRAGGHDCYDRLVFDAPGPARGYHVSYVDETWAGSFEGTTSVGLGVRARLPFRVITLADRILVDVAHFW